MIWTAKVKAFCVHVMVTAKLQASFSDKISYKRKQNPKLNDEIHAEDPF